MTEVYSHESCQGMHEGMSYRPSRFHFAESITPGVADQGAGLQKG